MSDEEFRIEFCSLDCFMELKANMEKSLVVAKELYPDWFVAKAS